MRPLRARASALLAVLALVVSSCSSPTETDRVSQVTLSISSLTLDAFGATQQVNAIARDQDFSPMTGVPISWSSAQTSVATVSSTGLITAVANGATVVTASAGNVSVNLNVTVAQAAVAPVVVSGGDQSAAYNTPLAQPVVVRVGDRLGNPIAGRAVTFTVISGGGSVGTTSMTPGADGLANTTWTLGALTNQVQRLSVVAEGVVGVTFVNATALAGPPTSVQASSPATGQTALLNGAVERRPAVVVRDGVGNLVTNGTVTFSVVSGGGSITGATANTNAQGVATVGSWNVGPALGDNVLRATVAGLTPVDFTVRGVADKCVAAGADQMELDVFYNGSITANDCRTPAPQNMSFDFFRFDLAAPGSVVIDMDGTGLDAFIQLYRFDTGEFIAENDDIVLGVNQDSRLAIQLEAGAYLLRARTFESGQVGTYTIRTRTAAVGVPTQVIVVEGQGQRVAPGANVPVAPAVAVLDESGLGVAGVPVNFATVPGVGAITGAAAVTDANGIARVGSWQLAAGANALSATVNVVGVAGNPAIISGTGKAAAPTAGFDISLRFVNMPTANQLATFSTAATRWETIITADIAAQPLVIAPGQCSSPVAMNETIDDLAIIVRLEPIDGAGQILGSAGPCALRNTGFLTVLGTMRFDTADLANLEANGNFGNVILHEMGHVLGIGTLWTAQFANRLVNPSPVGGPPTDTHFNGPAAVSAFNNVGGASYSGGQPVPVENTGGAGTINSHWRESILLNELMTGFLNAGTNPLSAVTIGSLTDVGYTVNAAVADPYAINPTVMAEGSTSATIEMKNDIWDGPRFRVDAKGVPVGQVVPSKRPKGQR